MTSWPELRMAAHPIAFLNSVVDTPGGFLRLRGGPEPKLLVWQPAMIDWIFRHDQRLGHPGSRSLAAVLGRRSLLWAEGQRHAAYRELLDPALHGRRLDDYRGIIAEAAHTAVEALRPGTVVGLPGWTRQLTLRIIARILLGEADDAMLAAFAGWIERVL